MEKLYSPHGGPRHLSTIPLKDYHLFKIAKSEIKDSHLFKIAESVISFCLKKNSDLAILNKW